MTKQEQKDAAWEAYRAIKEPAYQAYEEEIERIDSEPDEDIIEVDGKRYQLIKKIWLYSAQNVINQPLG